MMMLLDRCARTALIEFLFNNEKYVIGYRQNMDID